tara:strand:+ start:181 stop:984 length:804 start_codon:yes stop_codon:yes gene_type:complete
MSENTKVTAKQTEKKQFPTEFIDLPSQGWFYPENHPLSSGQVELKYMTAREEDILTSSNLIKKGIVIDTLINSLLVTDVTYDDLLVGDKNAIMIASRILGYGKDYDIDMTCPKCGEINKLSIDLTMLDNKEINVEKYTKGTNEFEFELPLSKTVITYQLMTGATEKKLDQELKGLAKFVNKKGPGKELTTRLKHQIIAIDGNREKQDVREFVDNDLYAQDSLALRTDMRKQAPDIASEMNFECDQCTHTETVDMPIDVNFFWPGTKS